MSDYRRRTMRAVAWAHAATIMKELQYDGVSDIPDEPPFEMDPSFEDPAEKWLQAEWDRTGGNPFSAEDGAI